MEEGKEAGWDVGLQAIFARPVCSSSTLLISNKNLQRPQEEIKSSCESVF